MKFGDIVNIKSSDGGFWKGKVTEISDKWEYKLKNGEILTHNYTHPLFSIKAINGKVSAIKNEHELEFKDGEYWEK